MKNKNQRLNEVYNIIQSSSYNMIITELALFSAIWKSLGLDALDSESLL